MSFATDKQTLDDLNIFNKYSGNAIYNLFNKTQTRGGAEVLENMFLHPLSDRDKIIRRSEVIKYFQEKNVQFPFKTDAFDAIEYYLNNTDDRTKIVAEENTLQRKFRNYMGTDTQYELLYKGIIAVIGLFKSMFSFLQEIDADNACAAYRKEVTEIRAVLQNKELSWIYEENGTRKIAYAKTAEYDQILRFTSRDLITKLLYHIYNLDVYIAVAKVGGSKGFTFAQALETADNTLYIEGMYHAQLTNPVPNTFEVNRNSNVIFLTGANMAGKSTFMKTLGVTLFLAHMGFPVPAKHMEFSVQKGMFTTINLADNLNMGYSHFYAEVLRLKKVAEYVSRNEQVIIIFDELFRGTNVKDAYDATVAVTEAFAAKRNCTFIISTHIIEAGEALKENCDNINFVYFPTVMNGNVPSYTYKLTAGITNDRHGMMIINNERIIERIRSRKNSMK
ncbi:MutS-related protein [Chitinophaga niabensis]|uniref:MutS domain III n=1 Tax=Chitinophaga niabensis TaxID=536979 RepID=A0A1N6D4G3_9BACT|nr:DNA mismatch repair protein [Chitinophaga niabensis]SIN65671.1 MutS domain III [Chitinophaga niabensis]